MKRTFFFLSLLLMCVVTACSDDDKFTASPTVALTFSVDSVKMDTVFATVGSRTYDFWVYNHANRGVRLSSVRLQKGNQTGFRVNVDGSYLDNTLGSIATDLEVRSGDSIRVFVELTAPMSGQQDPQLVEDKLLFTLENGNQQHVTLWGHAWDAQLMDSIVVRSDTLIESAVPIVILKGMKVDSAATLTLRNTTLYFHDKAGLDVYGTLKSERSVLRGDRLDHLLDYLPYDRVSGQWRGVHIYASSFENEFINTEIRNAEYGVLCDSVAFDAERQRLYMERSVIHNCNGPGLQVFNSWVGLLYCQFSNAGGDCLAFYGGAVNMDHCTVAQFMALGSERGAALRFTNHHNDYSYPLHQMRMTYSIVTGYDDDVVMGETLEGDSTTAFSYYFENCLLRTPALEDTVNCKSIIWENKEDSIQGEKHFKLVDSHNLMYDFHLDSLSTASGLGCYE
ncbi:MAG: right-handed parallel beta-helix repeat-containing protein [Prevotella sp.]|nr:right-handed parallel beta-helix repeat-containing protein [Prevotella sp.]